MRVGSLVLASAVVLAGCTIPVNTTPSPSPPTSSSATAPTALGATESRIFRLVNAERRRAGLPELAYNA
ncbi:MAG TPA: hypothetical protein VGO33_03665, partial [Gemmatimonadaceae bacterium]|nr:hypothetical protein [Gemmatimonadaceae bacterium]